MCHVEPTWIRRLLYHAEKQGIVSYTVLSALNFAQFTHNPRGFYKVGRLSLVSSH